MAAIDPIPGIVLGMVGKLTKAAIRTMKNNLITKVANKTTPDLQGTDPREAGILKTLTTPSKRTATSLIFLWRGD